MLEQSFRQLLLIPVWRVPDKLAKELPISFFQRSGHCRQPRSTSYYFATPRVVGDPAMCSLVSCQPNPICRKPSISPCSVFAHIYQFTDGDPWQEFGQITFICCFPDEAGQLVALPCLRRSSEALNPLYVAGDGSHLFRASSQCQKVVIQRAVAEKRA